MRKPILHDPREEKERRRMTGENISTDGRPTTSVKARELLWKLLESKSI
jgi:hypothetical protein